MAKQSCLASLALGFLGLLVLDTFTPTRCSAQTLPFLGRVDPERSLPRQVRGRFRAVDEKESPWLFFANPLVSGSNASWAGELDVGVAYAPPEGSRGLPFTLLGFGGRGKSVDGGSSFSYEGGYGDVTVYGGSLLTAKVLGVFSKSSSSRTLGGGASLDVKAGENFSLGGTALRSRAKESGETSDSWKYEARARAVMPFFVEKGQLSITPRYTFNVDAEDFYEVGLRLDLLSGFKNRASAVTLSAGKDSTITIGWELSWPGR